MNISKKLLENYKFKNFRYDLPLDYYDITLVNFSDDDIIDKDLERDILNKCEDIFQYLNLPDKSTIKSTKYYYLINYSILNYIHNEYKFKKMTDEQLTDL